MQFTSLLLPGEIVVDRDDHEHVHCETRDKETGDQRRKGRVPRDWSKIPHGALEGASPFPTELYVPRADWTARIAEMETAQNRVSDRLLNSQPYIPSLDQNGTNYCWCNAVVGCVQAVRAMMNEPYVALSACSVAALVKNFSNQGGFGGEALQYIISHGIAPLASWPNSTSGIQRSYDNADTQATRTKYKVTEWWDIQSGDFDAVMSCVLNGIPIAIGLNWWSHEVMACDGVVISPGKYGIRFRNSWNDTYGTKGFNVLTEAKATPDDACAPRVALAA